MMLQALYRLAQREQLMDDPDYEPKPVAWLIRLAPGGKLLGIESTLVTPEGDGKKKPRPVAKSFPVPCQSIRTSGDMAFFLVDKAEYVFGLDPNPDIPKRRSPEKLATRQKLFIDQIEACAKATNDEAVLAVLQFLNSITTAQKPDLSPEVEPNHLFAFVYDPDHDICVHQREAVRAYWKDLRKPYASAEQSYRCLISGQSFSEPGLFPLLKKVPGGTTSGVSLVSFNAAAFRSFGWDGNDNAPISPAAADACGRALNRLLDPAYPDPRPDHFGGSLPKRHIRISPDTIVLYWTSDAKSDEFVNQFFGFMEPDAGVVGDMYRSIYSGIAPTIENTSRFYALTLTGTQGRVIVRDWFESSVQDVAKNLARYFADLRIARNTKPAKDRPAPPALSFNTLITSLAPLGKADSIPDALATDLMNTALRGSRFPFSLMTKSIERWRAEIGKTEWADSLRRDARAALMKAVLNRTCQIKPEVTEMLDSENKDQGYLLGRLMAVIERLQQAALGDVNASVIDRYFAAASATPRAVFMRLQKNVPHYLKKMRDDERNRGLAMLLDKEQSAIIWNFRPDTGGYPASLPLQQQSLFILGYHHERHWLWLSKEEKEKLDQPVAASI
jgi:CRISPR-associated protein Csd1